MITRKLNERIFFISEELTKDDNGDPIVEELSLFSCWAEIAKATTKEFRDRSRENIEQTLKRREKRTLYIRFRTDVETDMVLRWRDKKYKVIDLEEDWKSKDMLMITVEVVE